MKKSYLFTSTLIAAVALSVPAFADGSGTSESPLSGTISDLNLNDYTGTDGVVYINGVTGGFATSNSEYTFSTGVNIGTDGLTITSGSTSSTYTFSGAITGSGDWTFTDNVAQNYVFTGDLSGYAGAILYFANSVTGSLTFGDGNTTSVTGSVSGTGQMVFAGGVTYNYGSGTVNIANSSGDDSCDMKVTNLTFSGTADYVVNVAYIEGYGGTNNSGHTNIGSTSGNHITISTTGSVTFAGVDNSMKLDYLGTFTVDQGSTLIIDSDCTMGFRYGNASYGLLVNGTLQINAGKSLTVDDDTNGGGATTSIANLVLGDGSALNVKNSTTTTMSLGTVTVSGAAAIKVGQGGNDYQEDVTIGALAGTGTLTLDSHANSSSATLFELGSTTNTSSTSQFTGTIVISDSNDGSRRSVSLIISEENIAAGAVIEFGTESASDGSLSLGVNAERVEIAGLSDASTHTGGAVIYAGKDTGDLGTSGGSITSNSETRNTLAINTATAESSYTFTGKVLNLLNIEKSGAGTQAIAFESGSSFDGSIAVKAGTLALSGEAINSTGLTVAADATLTIANSVSLVATSDVTSVSSTISGTLSVAEGGSLALDGTVTINNAISNSGSITIASTATITVGVEQQTYTTGEAYYVLITGGDGASVTFNGDISSFTGITFEGEWNVYTTGGYLVIYGAAAEATGGETSNNLIWNGTDGNNTWTTSADVTNWVDAESGDSNYYFSRGAAVTFNGTAENKSVVLGENITAGNVTFTEGGYTVSGDFSLTAGTLAAQHVDGSTVTIAVTELDVTSITMGNSGNDNLSDEYKHLVIGDGTTATTAKAESMSILGQSEIDIAADSTLTVSGNASFGGGYSMAIGGEGTLTIGGTITFSSSHELEVSIASLQAANFSMTGGGAATFSGASSTITETLTLGSANSSLTYTGEGTHTVTELLAHTTGTVTLDYSNLTGNLTIGTVDFGANGTLSVNGNANGTITTVSFTNTATLAISGTVNVGSVTAETNGAMANITIAEGATLNVSGAMTFHPGGFSSGNYSTITGAGTDKSTVVTGSLVIGEGTAGAGVEIKNTTFITGGITFSDSTSAGMFYLYLDDVTLGFTKDVTIAAGGESNSAIELGDKESGNGTGTTDVASTTTINTSKYDTTTGEFTSDGVSVEIAEQIIGTNAILAVEGAGSLKLSGATQVSGLTLSSGSLDIAGATSVSAALSVSGGSLSVSSGGSLDISGTTVTLASAISNSGTITVDGDTSFVIDGIEMGTGGGTGNRDYYIVIAGEGGSIVDGNTLTIDNFTLSDGTLEGTWGVYSDNGYLVIYGETSTTAETADTLYWAGTEDNNTWSTNESNTPWSATDGGSSGYYFSEGASVTFGPNTDGELSTTVVLGEDITAGTVNITGSGYTLTASDTTNGNTLTATSIILDDEETDGDTHTFTIAQGVTVTAGSLEEKAGQLDLVVNGSLDVTTMTVTTTQDESISGSGKLSVGTFEYSSDHGVSLTISVAEATFGSITEQSSGTENSGDLRHLIFGDGTSTTTASVTSMEIKGLSEVQVAKDSTLTITELVDSSGWNTTISGDGSIKIGSMTVSGNSTNGSSMLTISIANFESGAITFSGTNSLTISSASFKADSIVFSGGNDGNSSGAGGITISGGANAIVGLIQSDKTHTLTVEDGATLTAGEIYRSGNTLNLAVNGTLTVAQLEGYGDDGPTSGMIYFGKSGDGGTSMAQTISGTGTANVYGIEANLGNGSLTISVTNLNIGEGGITRYGSGSGTVNINGTKVGLYNTTASEISANITIGASGVTFNPESEGQTITLSGTVTGNGLVTKEGAGELAFTGTGSTLSNGLTVSAGTVSVATGASLTLGGTVTLASAISNSGSITIAEGTSFVINGIEMGNDGSRDYYVVIEGGDGASLTGTIDIGSFTLTDGSLEGWTLWDDGLSGGYLVIYGEASTTAQTADNLTWAGTDVAFTWNTSSENAIWNDTDTGTSGYYFTDGNNVTFGADGAYTTVAVEGEVTAGSTTINGAYTFNIGEDASVTTGALTYGEGGSLALTGSGKIVTGAADNGTLIAFDASDFTGEMDFTQGHLDIANSTFNEGATVVVTANTTASDDATGVLTTTDVSLSLAGAEENSNSELAANLVLDGNGGVIIRSNAASKTVTFSGSVTGESATLQLNGGGNAVFTNTVNVGKYTNYQGTTTFSGATTLGELTIYQPGDTDNGVTFTGSAAQATVTDITIHSSVGSVAATLTISDGASLSVGTMTINHDLAITIDSAAMSITGTVTQASSTSTSVTISNGGTLALGSDVSLNVAAMEIVLGTDTYTNGTYAITGESTSSLVVSEAAIKITVDSALANLLETDGTYTFDIYSGLSLSTDVFDIDDILGYSENVSWDNGVLTVIVGSGAIPEPELFSIFFGLGALGLVATRRRRRAA